MCLSNDGHDESGNLTTDAPDNEEDDGSEVNNTTDLTEDGENDKADVIKEELRVLRGKSAEVGDKVIIDIIIPRLTAGIKHEYDICCLSISYSL